MAGPMRRMVASVAATLPYAALVCALQAWPRTVGWPLALGNAALLATAMWAHAACYRLWQPHKPRAILANELLARLWFAVYAVVVASWTGADPVAVGAFGVAWAGLTWLVHARMVRAGYRLRENVALLGLFILGLALAVGTF